MFFYFILRSFTSFTCNLVENRKNLAILAKIWQNCCTVDFHSAELGIKMSTVKFLFRVLLGSVGSKLGFSTLFHVI